jgi:hypothetical protein
MRRQGSAPARFEQAVRESSLPPAVGDILIAHYGDPYRIERLIERLPTMTDEIRREVLRVMVKASGGELM